MLSTTTTSILLLVVLFLTTITIPIHALASSSSSTAAANSLEYDVTYDNDAAKVEAGRNTSSVEITVNEELESGVANLSMKENKQAIDNDKYQYDLPKPVGNSRKTQKAAQKKSKKAKRREKEEQSERDERIAAEKTRQKERAERLGIVDDENTITDSAGVETNNNLGNNGSTKPCNTCGGAFTPGEYRSHFRSDWHRYNVKLKMKNVAPVSEREFQLCDADAFFE